MLYFVIKSGALLIRGKYPYPCRYLNVFITQCRMGRSTASFRAQTSSICPDDSIIIIIIIIINVFV